MGKNYNAKTPVLVLCLVAAAVAVFYNALSGGFVFNDHYLVEYNPLVTQGGIKDFFNLSYQAATGRFLPLQFLSFGADYKLWSMNPFGFHLTNIILHAANAALVFLLFQSIFGNAEKRSVKILPAAAAALLFAVHPIVSEPVAWISGRKELLSALFTLLSALLYIKSYKSSAINNKSEAPLLVSLLLYIVAMLSHSSASALPFLLLATEFFITPGEGRETRSKKIERLFPFFFTGAIISGLNFQMALKVGAFTAPYGGSSLGHVATIVKIPLFYIVKIFYPINLCAIYSFPAETGLFSPRALAGAAVVVLLIVAFVVTAKKDRAAAWFISWAVAFSLPCMNFIPANTAVADRFAYLPSLGIFALAGLASSWASEALAGTEGKNPARFAPWVIVVALAAGLSIVTISRNADWKSDLSLWTSAVAVEPGNPEIRDNLGVAYTQMNDYSAAKKEFEEALRLNPDYLHSLLNLGSLEYRAFGDAEAALPLLEKAVGMQPRAVGGWAELADIYLERQEFQKAADAILMAIRFDPTNKNILNTLGVIIRSARSAGVVLDLPDFSAEPDQKYKLPNSAP